MGFSRKINIPTRGGGGNASDSEKLKELHRIIWITLCWLNHSWFHIHGRITAAIRWITFSCRLEEGETFKRDGHNWRKKKDGKTVMEGNEMLKVGHVHKLRCYYALGEENKIFKRRSYSMLEGDLSHIVLVHYWEEEVLDSSEGTSAYMYLLDIEALPNHDTFDDLSDIEALPNHDTFMPPTAS